MWHLHPAKLHGGDASETLSDTNIRDRAGGAMGSTSAAKGDGTLAIDCQKLDFAFNAEGETVLNGVDLQLERGSRCLLIGANGGERGVFIPLPPRNYCTLEVIRSIGHRWSDREPWILIPSVAGKSTLLRILAGKRLTKTRSCKILGQDVFMNPPNVRLPLLLVFLCQS